MHYSKHLKRHTAAKPAYEILNLDSFYQETLFAALNTVHDMPSRYDTPIPALSNLKGTFDQLKQFYEKGVQGLNSIVTTIEAKQIPNPFELINTVSAYTTYMNHINSAASHPFSKQNIIMLTNMCSKRVVIYKQMATLAQLACREERVPYYDLDLIYGHFLLWINQMMMIRQFDSASGVQATLTPIGQKMSVFYEKILDLLEPHISPESKFIRPYIAISLTSREALFVQISALEQSAKRYDPPVFELSNYIESLEDFENELVERAHALIDEFTLCRGMLEAFSGKLLDNIFSFEKRTIEIRKLMNLFDLFDSLSSEASSLLPRIIESKRDWDSRLQAIQLISPCPSTESLVDTISESTTLTTELANTLERLNLEAGSHPVFQSDTLDLENSSSKHIPLFEESYPKKVHGSKSCSQAPASLHPWAHKLAHHKDTLETIFSNGPVHFRALSHLISALGGTTFAGSKGIKVQIPKAHLIGDPREKGSLKNSIHPYHDARKGQPTPQRIVDCMRDFLEQCNLTPSEIWPAKPLTLVESSIVMSKQPQSSPLKSNKKSKQKNKKHKR